MRGSGRACLLLATGLLPVVLPLTLCRGGASPLPPRRIAVRPLSPFLLLVAAGRVEQQQRLPGGPILLSPVLLSPVSVCSWAATRRGQWSLVGTGS